MNQKLNLVYDATPFTQSFNSKIFLILKTFDWFNVCRVTYRSKLSLYFVTIVIYLFSNICLYDNIIISNLDLINADAIMYFAIRSKQ